jgi:retron-type reverse transcriptase
MVSARWDVPRIDDLKALAAWLGVAPAHLDWFADRRSLERRAGAERLRHYHRRWLTKADGSARLLEAPKRELKDLQRQVLHGILDLVPPHPAAHGFTRGRSASSGAAGHVGRDALLRFDLEAFFAGVTAGRVYGVFRSAGYPEPVAHALAALCTTMTPVSMLDQAPVLPAWRREGRYRLHRHLAVPHLPQGSPTSPALANLAAFGLDRRLSALARRLEADYTRYADDLTFSGGRRLLQRAPAIVRMVEGIVAEEGFRINDSKTRVRSSAQRQLVTGLVVNRKVNIPRPVYDRLRAVLHDAARHGPQAANRIGHPDFRAHLEGRIAWVGVTNPARAAKLRQAFDAIQW